MTPASPRSEAATNIALYPWYKVFQNLLFWQSVWFLYFQNQLSAAEAVLLYAIYDVGTTALEVPSGYMSDRLGRRLTLIAAAMAGVFGSVLLAFGSSFAVFAAGQLFLGAGAAFASGTDSAMLYESLAAEDRVDEIEAQELRAWRFSFGALAVSAVVGGAMTLLDQALPFVAGAVAFVGLLIITIRFAEPPRAKADIPQRFELMRLRSLGSAFAQPALRWLFVLSVLMYAFSHVPFVFGQPFILEALEGTGLQAEAPLVSGVVSASMMVLSVLISLAAPGLRRGLGLPVVLLVAFGLQVASTGVLAVTNSVIAIAFLFFRMVPDALARPFILARLQPMLSDDSRATFLSLQSFCGRLLFAGTLLAASAATSAEGPMPYEDIQRVLRWYVAGGLICLAALAVAVRGTAIEDRR